MSEEDGGAAPQTPQTPKPTKSEGHHQGTGEGHHPGLLERHRAPPWMRGTIHLAIAILASLAIGKAMEWGAEQISHNHQAVAEAIAGAQAETVAATGVLLHFDKIVDPPQPDYSAELDDDYNTYGFGYINCEAKRSEAAREAQAAALAEISNSAQDAEANFGAKPLQRDFLKSEPVKGAHDGASPGFAWPTTASAAAALHETESDAAAWAAISAQAKSNQAAPVQAGSNQATPQAAPSDPCVHKSAFQMAVDRAQKDAATAHDVVPQVKMAGWADKSQFFKPQLRFADALWSLTTQGGLIGRTIYQIGFGGGLLLCLLIFAVLFPANPGGTLLSAVIWVPVVTLLIALPFALLCHFMINLGATLFGWVSPGAGLSSSAGIVVFGVRVVVSKSIEIKAQQRAEHLAEKL